MSVSNRTFGIELECYMPRGKTAYDLANAISATGNICSAVGYTHAVLDSWKLVSDASLGSQNGIEIVSPILRGEAGLLAARQVAQAASGFGCKVKLDCGFHCHIGIEDFNISEMRALMLNYVWFEDFFDHILPESRRRNTSRWVNSNRNRFGGYGTEAVNAAFPILNAALERAKTATDSPYIYSVRPFRDGTRDYPMETMIHAFVGSQRYLKLNLYTGYLAAEHRPGNKCAEFRQHSGTIDPDKVCNWIRLKCAFVDKSKVSNPRPRTVTRDLTPAEEMHRFFAYLGTFCENDVKDYYMERRRKLAKEVAVTARAQTQLLANADSECRALITALEARMTHISGFARPPRLRISAIRNALYSLQNSMTGNLPFNASTRAEYVAQAVCRVRNSNLLPADRSAPISASVALAA